MSEGSAERSMNIYAQLVAECMLEGDMKLAGRFALRYAQERDELMGGHVASVHPAGVVPLPGLW